MSERARRCYGYVRPPRAARGPAPGARSSRRRAPRRGLWVLTLGLLSCLSVATIFISYHERPDETASLTAVDRPASAKPPNLPVDPARVRAFEELRARLPGISEAHTGTHGVVVFDPYRSEERRVGKE